MKTNAINVQLLSNYRVFASNEKLVVAEYYRRQNLRAREAYDEAVARLFQAPLEDHIEYERLRRDAQDALDDLAVVQRMDEDAKGRLRVLGAMGPRCVIEADKYLVALGLAEIDEDSDTIDTTDFGQRLLPRL